MNTKEETKTMGAPSLSGSKNLIWFITGTSQGFGYELVRAALQRGDSVVATSRTPEKIQKAFVAEANRLLAIPLDLRSPANIAAGVAEAIQRFGRIDVLVNNAGHGLVGALEEVSDPEIKNVFEINVFGLIRLTRAVLPYFRKQHSGHVVNLSSIGGLVGLPGWGMYSATKFAVEGLSEALAAEGGPLGIKVTIVEPGPFRTDFLGGSLTTAKERITDYESTAGQSRQYAIDRNGDQPGDPVLAAKAIIQAVTSENPPLHLLLGALAYQRAATKIENLQKDFEAWRDIALATDFDAAR
jgi:NAD(P)-dependent dehydrogenase (short-subunit alcohol dehydrogenase family)